MRVASQPRGESGKLGTCQSGHHLAGLGRVLSAGVVALAVCLLVWPDPAAAQDPTVQAGGGQKSSFPTTPGGMFGPKQTLDRSKPLYLQGDQLVYDTKGNRVVARGNVEIYYNNNVLTADEVIYDQSANTLTAIGNVALKDANGNLTRADRYTLTDDFRDGFVQSLSMVTKDNTRIWSERAVRRDASVTEFQKGRFTPCKSEGGMPPLWCISAATVVHDQNAATITYQDAQFEMFGMPLLYLPYFQHADPSVKRKSGFLQPSFGSSSTLGYSTEIPYYFSLDPSYDFTLHPRYFTKQGVLWQGDWRQKLGSGEYMVALAGIDQGNLNFEDNGPVRATSATDGFRGSIVTRGQFSLSSWWKTGWDATFESDNSFRRFYQLDSLLITDRVNTTYLVGQSDRNYFSAQLYQFHNLTESHAPGSTAFAYPIVNYNYVFADPVLGGELSWRSNAVAYTGNGGVAHEKWESLNRASTVVDWRRKLTDPLGIVYTPAASLRGDVVQASNYIDPVTGLLVGETTAARGLATGSATVSWPWLAGNSHVVEPIGQIIVRQASVDQFQLPNDDARSLIFDDTNLFETSKFSGYDRLETGVRANYGVQYTFQSGTGPFARVLVGQSNHLAGDNAYANLGITPATDAGGNLVFNTFYSAKSGLATDRSDYVLGAYIAPTDIFRIISQSRFDESSFDLRREDLTAVLNYGPVTAAAIYTYAGPNSAPGVTSELQGITGVLGLKLTDHWSMQASAIYDLTLNKPLTNSLQLKYSDECFVLTATYTDSYITDPTRDLVADRSIMLRFEWKYLGQLNYRTTILDNIMPSSYASPSSSP